MMNRGLDRRVVPNRLLREIAEQIRKGHIMPGDRLPPEREWAVSFGVSRHSLRQAIKILEVLGVVDCRPKTGTIVKEFSLASIMEMSNLLLQLSSPPLDQVLEARRLLEGIMGELASRNHTAEDLLTIRQHLVRLQQSTSLDELIEEDAAFHLAISHATHNQILDTLLQQVSGYLRESVRTIRIVLYSRPEVNAMFTEHHTKIYEAVAAKNGQLASYWINEHLLYAETETARQIRTMVRKDTAVTPP